MLTFDLLRLSKTLVPFSTGPFNCTVCSTLALLCFWTIFLLHYITVLHYQCCITAHMQSSLNGVGTVTALTVVKIVVGFVFS